MATICYACPVSLSLIHVQVGCFCFIPGQDSTLKTCKQQHLRACCQQASDSRQQDSSGLNIVTDYYPNHYRSCFLCALYGRLPPSCMICKTLAAPYYLFYINDYYSPSVSLLLIMFAQGCFCPLQLIRNDIPSSVTAVESSAPLKRANCVLLS